MKPPETAPEAPVDDCRMCGMLNRMESVFLEAPEGQQDPEAVADIHVKREAHAPYCLRNGGAE